jgi:hypothetical protein
MLEPNPIARVNPPIDHEANQSLNETPIRPNSVAAQANGRHISLTQGTDVAET